MTTAAPAPTFFDRMRWLSSELVLGTLIALLSIFTGVSSYQGSMSDSDQNKYQNEGMQTLTDANAEYLTANQFIVYDYSLYDAWFLDETGSKAEYYQANFSEALQSAIAANPDDPFNDSYYEAQWTEANQMFADADAKFSKAEEFNTRGDQLQLVMMVMAIGLAFAAWASLLGDESKVRLLFTVLAIITAGLGLWAFLNVPAVVPL